MTRAPIIRTRTIAVLALSVLSLLVAASCSNDSPKQQPTATPTESPAAVTCPVDQAICDFAETVEKLVQARDYAAIAATSPGIAAGVRQQAEQAIPTGTPKLVSIGCPDGGGGDTCARSFLLVFTTLKPSDDWTGSGGIFILRYQRREPAAPELNMVNQLVELEARRSALAGERSNGGPCNLSGTEAPQTEQTCTLTVFHSYSTDGSVFAPVDVQPQNPFKVLDPIAPPNETVMFIATGCWGCEGYSTGIQVVVTDSGGNTTTRKLPEPPLLDGEGRTSLSLAADASLLVASTCKGTNCGPLGSPTADVRSRVLASSDAGATWSELAAFPGYATADAGPGGKILVSRTYGDGPPETWTGSWVLLPGNTAVTRPANADAESRPLFLADGSIGWHRYEGYEILRADGSVVFRLPAMFTAATRVGSIAALADGSYLVWWTGPSRVGSYITRLSSAGAELWTRQTPAMVGLSIGRLLDASHAIGNTQAPASGPNGQLPVLVDLDAGTAQPIGAPFGQAPLVGRNHFLAMLKGRFTRVNTGSDCLNVRETPSTSAKVLQCAANGAMLQVFADRTSQAEGIGWVNVRTLGGEDGWVSAEFLQP